MYEDRSKPGIDMAAVDRDMAALEASRDRWKERAERLEAELTHCSDELGTTRMALNDEMYKRDAERQHAARLEAADKVASIELIRLYGIETAARELADVIERYRPLDGPWPPEVYSEIHRVHERVLETLAAAPTEEGELLDDSIAGERVPGDRPSWMLEPAEEGG